MKDSDRKFIAIKWDKPANDGGAPIKGYNVERKDPKTDRWVKLNRTPVKVSEARIEKLLMFSDLNDFRGIEFHLESVIFKSRWFVSNSTNCV